MALPANLSFCTVTGRFIRAIGDTDDEGSEPDGVPIEGLTVKFTASTNVVRVPEADPPAIVILDPIICATDSDGVLVDPDGNAGLTLVATDDEDMTPYGWTYKVEISGPSFPSISFNFNAPSGATVDLATAVPVAASGGTGITLMDGGTP